MEEELSLGKPLLSKVLYASAGQLYASAGHQESRNE
jgi:hypothetical protein